MSKLVLQGIGELTLSVDTGCLVLEMNRKGKQKRVIPIIHILCVEVSEPKEEHRGYIYFRTPTANRAIKSAITRDYIIDDDIVFFNDAENYEVAQRIQDYIVNYVST